MTQDNKYLPGGCSIGYNNIFRAHFPANRESLEHDARQENPEIDRVDVYTKAQDKYIFTNSFPEGTEPLQVPEKLYTKKELDDVVKAMDLVVESLTRRLLQMRSQQDVYVEEAKRANDRGIRQGLTFSKIYSELSDSFEAYQTLVHAREYLRHNGNTIPMQKAISILNNALIDMEG